MVRHIFLDKTNTITRGSLWNTGLNPILELNYGNEVSRGLIHFDVNEIGDLISDGTFCDPAKLICTRKMTNCASVDGLPYDKYIHHRAVEPVERATSFDLVLYRLPQEFDAGKGFEYVSDFWLHANHSRAYVDMPSNWYYSESVKVWDADKDKVIPDDHGKIELDAVHPSYFYQYAKTKIVDVLPETGETGVVYLIKQKRGNNYSGYMYISGEWKLLKEREVGILTSGTTEVRYRINLEGGVYKFDRLIEEYDRYLAGDDSIIVGSQHFDFGAENLEIDITKYVLDCLENGKNYAIIYTEN